MKLPPVPTMLILCLSASQALAATPDRFAVQRRQVNHCMTQHMLKDRVLTYNEARKLCLQQPAYAAQKLAANGAPIHPAH